MLNLFDLYSNPRELVGYGRQTLVPSIAYQVAGSGASLSPAALRNLAQDAQWAFKYTRDIIRQPWPQAEPAIAKDPDFAWAYALDVLKRPWPQDNPNTDQALKSIQSDAESSYFYTLDVINDDRPATKRIPWPPGEPVIAKNPFWAYYYASKVFRGPWPKNNPNTAQALTSMKADPVSWSNYLSLVRPLKKKK